jgi:hypothetical protein
MVVHFIALATLATALRFDRTKAFWIALCLGLFFDLLHLSTPLGFYLFLCAFMTMLMSLAKPYFHSLKGVLIVPPIFVFLFLFSLLECTLVGFLAHPFEDLFLGPALDCGVFLVLRFASLKISPFFQRDSLPLFGWKKNRFFSPKNPFFRKVSQEEVKRSNFSFLSSSNIKERAKKPAIQEEKL